MIRTTFRTENMGQRNFKKHSKFQTFDEIFCGSMTRLRKTNVDVIIQRQHRGIILRNENMRRSLFKKHSRFYKFDKILHCWMARFRKVKLDVFRQYQNTKTIIKKKNMGQNRFTKRSNFKKFQLSNFTLNSVRPDMTYSKNCSKISKYWKKLF